MTVASRVVSKHRLHEDDETTLLPRTVEQLAEEERRPRGFRRQPVVIAVATASLLASGAAAWALAGPTSETVLAQPTSGPTTPGAGFVDGFGVVTPSATTAGDIPAARPSTTGPAPAPSATASVAASPAASAPSGVAPSPPSPPPPSPPSATATATYDVQAWPGGYVIAVQVRNTGTTPLQWTVRIGLPNGATVNGDWEADRSAENGVWVFTPERGALAPGAVASFGFMGPRGPGDFPVSCTVNGVACQRS